LSKLKPAHVDPVHVMIEPLFESDCVLLANSHGPLSALQR